MIGKLRTFLVASGLVCALAGSASAQAPEQTAKESGKRASAYYNFAMGHMFADLAANYGYRSDYVDKAVEHYRAALAADPDAGFVSEELTDLYLQAGKLRDAVNEAEGMLKRDPNNADAHRMLGRIYARLIGDPQQNHVNAQMLKQAIEQYQKVTELEPGDTDSWLWLGKLYKVAQDSDKAEQAYKKVLERDPDNDFALSGLAQVYSDRGDSKAALEIWRKLADRDPRPQLLQELARAYQDAGDYKGAVQTLRRALDMAPHDPELTAALAENLLLSNDTDGALKLYGELAASDPNNARLQLRISQIYREKHDFAKAHEAQNRAAAIAPDNIEVRYNEVNLLQAEGKTGEAIARLKAVIDSRPAPGTDPGARAVLVNLEKQLGILCRANEQYPEALAAFRKMAELDPDSGADVSAQIIETYRQAREFDNALTEAAAAVTKYPGNRTIKVVRASLLADMGRVDEAAAAARQLLNGKDDRDTYLVLAQIYDKGKRFKEEGEALEAADKLSLSDDDKESVAFLRGAMYEKMQKLPESEAQFRKVLELNPENAAALNYLGYMLADRNLRLQEARELISKALEIEPNNGAYLDSLGWVNFRLGRLDEAATYLLRALDHVPTDPTVREHLGDVYLQQGRLKDAIAQWEISLREWNRSAISEVDPVQVAKIQKKLEGARVRLAKETGTPAAVEHR
jgi:tetratricopeptide (TPR) repeat protein